MFPKFHKIIVFCLVLSLALTGLVPILPAQARPLQVTTRHGGWFDTIVMSETYQGAVVSALSANEIDIYGGNLSSSGVLQQIQSAGLNYTEQFTGPYELTLNPSGPIFANGKLNPFAVAKIREALNWLVDRDWIVENVYHDAARAKYVPVSPYTPDHVRHIAQIRSIEQAYAYNAEQANQVITAEMLALGASKNIDGKWTYNQQPITLIFIIRNDGDGTRVGIGNYVADQLELLGFNVDRQYLASWQASPLWLQGNPAQGLWHLYTGGWITSSLSRDDGGNFSFFYTPDGLGQPLWAAYKPSTAFWDAARALNDWNFANMAERTQVFNTALQLSMQNSYRIWLVDQKSFSPYRSGFSVSASTYNNLATNPLWPHTLRNESAEGGLLRWANNSLLVDPANPVAGSNWVYDRQWQIATADSSLLTNPLNGLPLPQRLESVQITIQNGLPVANSSPDWLTLNVVSQINVPANAWLDWNPTTKQWKTVGALHPGGLTARAKVVIRYPAGMYSQIAWHDGSPLSAADFVLPWVERFALGTSGSNIYEPALGAQLEQFKYNFRGIRFVSTEPLVIEYYTDAWQLDAELMIPETWPHYGSSEAPWHVIALGNAARAAGQVAYTSDAADSEGVDWLNLVSGPSLGFLSGHLTAANATPLIPYPNVMGAYITNAAAQARYANLQAWYGAHQHFWVGAGPYFLDTLDLDNYTLTLSNNPAYLDLADKWQEFAAPGLASVTVTGPDALDADQPGEVDFAVEVTANSDPLPPAEIESVSYVLSIKVGATPPQVLETGLAVYLSPGQYRITLDDASKAKLFDGMARLEAQVIAKNHLTPVLASHSFETVSARPEPFGKQGPLDGLIFKASGATLSWGASVDASEYAYCVDEFNDNLCQDDAWVNLGDVTSTVIALTPGKTYYWQVKVLNAVGERLADFGSWWSFRLIKESPFKSLANNDGFILESSETSGKGGTLNATATTFNLGDDASDRQYRAILHFAVKLPANAVITGVRLKIKKQGLTGTNPFSTHGKLLLDLRKPYFGPGATLGLTDFEAPAGKTGVASFGTNAVSNWYTAVLPPGAWAYINKNGTTQIRLRFTKDDNDDRGADYMKFFSGNATNPADRPQLIVEYYVP